MIGVDTNVLVRFLARDVKAQAELADRFFAERTAADPAFVSLMTAAEAYWVLRKTYKFDHEVVSRGLRALLATDEVVFQAPDVVRRGLRHVDENGGDFADAVIALLSIDAGADFTVTLDRRAAKLPGMVLLDA